METYAVYLVTVHDDHTKDVDVLFKGTFEEASAYAGSVPREQEDRVQVLPWRAAYKERVAHGVGISDNDLRGNIHHLVNPLIGFLSLKVADDEKITGPDAEYYISRLRAVVALADEYFGKYEEQREFEKWLKERNG